MPEVLIAAIGVFVAGATPQAEQEARARSLIFDPEKQAWVEQTAPTPGTPEGDLYHIKILNERKEFRAARARSDAFVKAYGRDHALYPEVLIRQAEALIGLREFSDAHEVLQEFLGSYGGMGLTEEALRLELVVAEAFLAGAKRRVWRIFRVSATDLGLRILDEIAVGYPESAYAEAAIKTKADYLFKEGEYDLAELEYARLLRDYPQTRYRQYALRRAADAALASFAGVDYDEAALIEAEERYREYRSAYPDDARREGIDVILEGIRQSRAEKDFQIGRYYERIDRLSSAVFYYRLVERDWPGTIAAAKATRRLARLEAPVDAEAVSP